MTQVKDKPDTKIFGNPIQDIRMEDVLVACQNAGYTAVFMPELIEHRISAYSYSSLWDSWIITPSVRVTGITKSGTPVVVYAHVENYFSNPANIKASRERGLRNGAGEVPQEEFQRLVDLEDGQTVFVVDYETLRKSSSHVISVYEALGHPQTIPFLGGKDRAVRYLEKHRQIYGERIGIWHIDDLVRLPPRVAWGRVLSVTDHYLPNTPGGLSGCHNLDAGGYFLGKALTSSKEKDH